MSDIRKLLEAVDRFQFAGEPEQEPGDQVRGTEVAKPRRGKHPFQGRLVGSQQESVLKELEEELSKPKHCDARKLMQEYREFVQEYGGVGGIGAAPQSPQGTTTAVTPQQKQAQDDLKTITKNVQGVKSAVTSQGGAPINPSQAVQTLGKVNVKPNVSLSNKDQEQVSKFAPALANILKNPQTAGQFKQLMNRAGTLDQQTDQKLAKQTSTQASTSAQQSTQVKK